MELFCFFYLVKVHFQTLFCNLSKVPPLSAAPHPPRVIQEGHKGPLRGMRSGLTKVEKLQFWLGFEPTLILKNQKLSKNDKNCKVIINACIAGKWVQGVRILKLAISLNSLVQIDFNYLCSVPILYKSTPHSQRLAKFQLDSS